METLVRYHLADGVAVITLDDGKVNVLGLAMQDQLNAALDRAEADGAAVLLTGNAQVFSPMWRACLPVVADYASAC